MIKLFEKYTKHKKVLILGYGREGRSSHRFINKCFPELSVGIADQNQSIVRELEVENGNLKLHLGKNYLESVKDYEVVIKSPGIKLSADLKKENGKIWLSQTGLFLECYRDQIIGITGTKGKSTTSSLIYHMLKQAGAEAILVGNIGKPPFNLLGEVKDSTKIVFEFSANQLENVKHSPQIAILLNLFPEHLDYFGTIERYYHAKLNICKFQTANDFFIYDGENENVQKMIHTFNPNSEHLSLAISEGKQNPFFNHHQLSDHFDQCNLQGNHNRKNLLAAAMAAKIIGVSDENILAGVASFKPLAHRLEYLGNFCGIDFYNDSISTVPESTIEAIKTLKKVNMLILGGFDRGISYKDLLGFMADSQIKYFAFTGPAGKRMMREFELVSRPGQNLQFFESFNGIAAWFGKVGKGNVCLLSPAAPSYDQFKDFEERGSRYKKMAENFAISCR